MTKQEFLEFSLSKGLNLWQSCKYWAVPAPDRVVTLTGIGDTDGKLPMQYNNEIAPTTIFYRLDGSTTGTDYITNVKPICHPLSDLTKEIEHKGEKFVPIEKLGEIIGGGWCDVYEIAVESMQEWDIDTLKDKIKYLPFEFVQFFVSWHFDLFGGIENKEAINVNDLKTNPYK